MISQNKMPKRTSVKTVNYSPKQKYIDVFKILAERHPQDVDDYAIHLYYAYRNRNPRFKVHDKKILSEELAELLIDNKHVRVNVRTGVIQERILRDSEF